MFSFAPDNRIKAHPVRCGTPDAEWTAVIGRLEGTFTKPMVLADGKSRRGSSPPLVPVRERGNNRHHGAGHHASLEILRAELDLTR